MPPRKRYRCIYCGVLLPAWLPVAKRPEGSMLLYHLGQHHLQAVGPYLARMEVESIDRVLAELFERVVLRPRLEGLETRLSHKADAWVVTVGMGGLGLLLTIYKFFV